MYRLLKIFALLIAYTTSCSAQDFISYDRDCDENNRHKMFNALSLAFGEDSICYVLSNAHLTGITVYLDSLGSVVDVKVRNRKDDIDNEYINKRLLWAIHRNNYFFPLCHEVPPIMDENLDTEGYKKRICKIKENDIADMKRKRGNLIPISIVLNN